MVAGDRAALAELYEATSAAVYGLALQLVRDARIAEDVTMETYVQAWERAETYRRSTGTVDVWLLAIARSRALERGARSRSRLADGRRRLDPDDRLAPRDERPALGDAGPTAVRGMGLEESGLVQRALHELPPDQRDALLLVYNRGLSLEQAARAGGETVETIENRVRLGLQRIRSASTSGKS